MEQPITASNPHPVATEALTPAVAPSIDAVRAAADLLAGIVRHTPLVASEWLSDALGRPVYLKLETLQVTGSFKVRGAVTALDALDAEARARGVITASAGNHGMGVAWAARRLGARATVVVPRTAVASKVEGLRRLGARVVLHGEDYEAAHHEALRLAEVEHLWYVHAFVDPRVIAGQASVTAEILAELPDLSCLVAPIGGGGLIGGAGIVLAAERPAVRLVGVQAVRADGMARSVAAGAVVPWRRRGPTLADGLAGSVEALTLDLALRHVAQVAVVREREILSAIGMLLTRDHVLAEGSAAVGVAALAQGRVDLPAHGAVAVVVSGGNIDPAVAARALRRVAARPEVEGAP